jgi:NIMA (never in mitosis gene a)-related kinase
LISDIFVQLVSILFYCHQNNLIHSDIKPENIFLARAGIAKLFDFGISKILTLDAKQAQTYADTHNYMSPEVVEGKPY